MIDFLDQKLCKAFNSDFINLGGNGKEKMFFWEVDMANSS